MGWCEGVVIDDLMNAIRSASRSALEDGMRNSYLYISYDGDVESIDPWQLQSGPVRSNRPQRRHGNWDEFISTRLTMYLLGENAMKIEWCEDFKKRCGKSG